MFPSMPDQSGGTPPQPLSDYIYETGVRQMVVGHHDVLGVPAPLLEGLGGNAPEPSPLRYDEALLEAIATAMSRVPCRIGRFSEPGDEEEHRMEQAVAALDAIEAYWLRVSA